MKISELTALVANPASDDYFVILDTSVLTTKKLAASYIATSGENSNITSLTGMTTPLTVAQGGTGQVTLADGGIVIGNATGGVEVVAAGATTTILVGGGAATKPVWTTATGSGAPVRATSPTLVTPALGTPSALVLTNASGTVTNLTLVTPALGTPSSGALTSCTGLPLTTGITGTLAVGNGGTGATTLTDGGVLLGSGTGAITAMAVLADGEIIVGDGTTDPVAESGATARTSLGAAASGANADITSLRGLVYDIQVYNLKPAVNGDVNKLDVFTKTGGAVPDATNPIIVSIPDGNGFTNRTRNAAYLSGTSQFIMADATNYWSKGSLDAEIKTAYVYAIWDANGGIVWALGGYSGFTRVPASITETDDDFFLLEASSTYTKVITDYCVCVGKIRYQYDTADAPDHTIQATVLDAPQVCWNPKSDYSRRYPLATSVTSASNIAETRLVEIVIKQSGKYEIHGALTGQCPGVDSLVQLYIKTGSSTYASAVQKARCFLNGNMVEALMPVFGSTIVLLNAGDAIHLGGSMLGAEGTRKLLGDNDAADITYIWFRRID